MIVSIGIKRGFPFFFRLYMINGTTLYKLHAMMEIFFTIVLYSFQVKKLIKVQQAIKVLLPIETSLSTQIFK